METLEKTLPYGLPTNQGSQTLQRIVFGRRPIVADSIKIEDSPQAEFELQKGLMYARVAIIEFGDKKRPPHLSELLRMNRADRETIMEGYSEFLSLTQGDRISEKIDADSIKLAFGLVEDGESYDTVTLSDKGSLLTGYDENKIEREAGGPYEAMCIVYGHDIARFSQSEGSGIIEGPISLTRLKLLDAMDLNFLVSAAGERRRLFRKAGSGLRSDAGMGSSLTGD